MLCNQIADAIITSLKRRPGWWRAKTKWWVCYCSALEQSKKRQKRKTKHSPNCMKSYFSPTFLPISFNQENTHHPTASAINPFLIRKNHSYKTKNLHEVVCVRIGVSKPWAAAAAAGFILCIYMCICMYIYMYVGEKGEEKWLPTRRPTFCLFFEYLEKLFTERIE